MKNDVREWQRNNVNKLKKHPPHLTILKSIVSGKHKH